MSCSARLPVYTLLIGAFVPHRHFLGGLVGLPFTMFRPVSAGHRCGGVVALILRTTLFRGDTPPFIMELPL